MFHKNILFGLPVYHFKINPNLYDKKNILNTIEKNYKINENRDKSLYGDLHHSFMDEENEKFKKIDYVKSKLVQVYNNIFKDFTNNVLKTQKKFSYNYTIENYTATKNNQYMKSHNHLPDVDFTSVHYLQFDRTQHQNTVFLNMNDFGNYIRHIRKDFYNCVDSKSFENSYLFSNFSYNVEEDDMIIFPSILKHEIPKQKNNLDKLRVTIVCNLKIEKYE